MLQETPARTLHSVRPMMLASATRSQVLASVRTHPNLPSPPGIAARIFELVNDPNAQVADLASIVVQDPGLSATMLRVANSALYGFRQPVTSIPRAVTLLGLNRIRSLVLSISVSGIRPSSLSPDLMRVHWRVSLGGALAAQELAQRIRPALAENAFVMGLVRDLGILVLSQLFPDRYLSILASPPDILAAFQCDLEDRAVQIDHALVSAALLEDWRMPKEITEPIRCHHNWTAVERLELPLRERGRLLYLASRIGQLHSPKESPLMADELFDMAMVHFGLKPCDIQEILGTVQSRLREVATLLGVDIGTAPSYAEALARSPARPRGTAVHAGPPQPTVSLPIPAISHPVVTPKSQNGEGTTPPASPAAHGPVLAELLTRLLTLSDRAGVLGLLGSYEVVALLGHGAMGAVFRARDPNLQRTVAIKAMLPSQCADGRERERFINEGRAVAALTHENIIGIHSVGEVNGVPYLVMEYVGGGSLQDRLDNVGRLPLPEVIRIGLQAVSGLAVAHEKGVIHRDIKPANLLLEEKTCRIKVADFGLAHVLVPNQGRTDEIVGTPHFMSPEQATGQVPDPRSDLFSLGCILYLCSTGQLPFPGEDIHTVLRQILDVTPPPVRQLDPSLPDWFSELVEQLLAKNPTRRGYSAQELKWLLVSRWVTCFSTKERSGTAIPRLNSEQVKAALAARQAAPVQPRR